MIDAAEIASTLPPVHAMRDLVSDQGTSDIIGAIIRKHKAHLKDYDQFADYFLDYNTRATCKNIWDFLKENLIYDVEPKEQQTVKSPAAILAEDWHIPGGKDCKHYSLFAAGVLDAINRRGGKIPWCFRFVSYENSSDPHHVFVVAWDEDGREIWIDPVMDDFDDHSMKPIYQLDKCVNSKKKC